VAMNCSSVFMIVSYVVQDNASIGGRERILLGRSSWEWTRYGIVLWEVGILAVLAKAW
jgi:hypothetical protein